MNLSDLFPAKGSKKKRKRIGKGPGSGHGKTATKGHKGQAARSGGVKGSGFEGGQQPLIRRVPKRGFHPLFRKEYALVNLAALNRFPAHAVVNPQRLYEKGLIKNVKIRTKVLGDGTLTRPLCVALHRFSRQAMEKIQAAGGSVEVIL